MSNLAVNRMPLSPITCSSRVRKINQLSSAHIINAYKKQYKIDVSQYFEGIESVDIIECLDSGFRFYYPFSLVGKEDLYERLHHFPFYYLFKKWEYMTALKRLKPSLKVLDVGCGQGAFIKLAQEQGVDASGLETNLSAAIQARSEGLNVISETIQEHASENPETYDAVVSFQVLEHVTEVKSFLQACILTLKPLGLLMIGVPNNNSFIKHDPDFVLNTPPHHMGLWTLESLAALPQFFPIDLEWIEYEPLTTPEWYQAVMEQKYLPPNQLMRTLYYRIGLNDFFKRYIQDNSDTINGHTILAVYRHRL